MNNIITCHNCWTKGDCSTCPYKSNLEIENRGAEKAIADIYRTFCIFCFVLIVITLI